VRVRTSSNIWLVFDGLRERTRKVAAAAAATGRRRRRRRRVGFRQRNCKGNRGWVGGGGRGKEGPKRGKGGGRRWRRVLRSTNGAADEP